MHLHCIASIDTRIDYRPILASLETTAVRRWQQEDLVFALAMGLVSLVILILG
jgi:hypothetical protein